MRRSNEPLAWSLFGAGGMMLAFLGPAMICATFVLAVSGADDPQGVFEYVSGLLTHPLGKLTLLVFIALSIYHTAHRMYHGLHDIHLVLPKVPMLLLFYGGATALSLLTGVLLLRL